MPDKFWIGTPPARCDLCPRPLKRQFYDARTRQGPWGCLCTTCFREHGVGLGTGCGQMYQKQPDGRFKKIKG